MTSLNHSDALPTFDDIIAAEKRIDGIAIKTPLLESKLLNERLGGRILFKPECLQKTGSFKFRGATNNIACLSDAAKTKGVVAFSSGNHAQGVALAATTAGVRSTIIMPEDAPMMKIENTKDFGAEVILYNRYTEDREEIGREFAERTGATLIKPYDAPLTIAGQGTIGLEIADQCLELDILPDYLLSPCGGGGLMAGICLAMAERMSTTKLYSVEPNGFDDTKRSLETGNYEVIDKDAKTYCDAIMTPTPGQITFPINQKHLSGGLSVSDAEVGAGMLVAFEYLKLVVEPGACVGLAALLANQLPLEGKSAVVILSGGNVDADLYKTILSDQLNGRSGS